MIYDKGQGEYNGTRQSYNMLKWWGQPHCHPYAKEKEEESLHKLLQKLTQSRSQIPSIMIQNDKTLRNTQGKTKISLEYGLLDTGLKTKSLKK